MNYLKVAAITFKPSQFALVSGLLATAAMAGSLSAQTPLAYLVGAVGWQKSLVYCGMLGMVLALVYISLVKNPAKSLASKTATISFKDVYKVLQKKSNWYLILYSGLAFSPLAVFGGLWGDPFLEATDHFTKTEAASLTSLMFLGLALGGPLCGVLATHLKNKFHVMFSGLFLSLVSVCFVIYTPFTQTWFLGLNLFLFGFGTGAFMLGFGLGKDLNPLPMAATVMSMINTGDAILGAVSEPLVGKLLDVFWRGKTVHLVHVFSQHDYHWTLFLLPFYLCLGLMFLYLVKLSAYE